ncbi:MAG: hypothetical protein ACREDK_00515 [Thermoplasmata archaeon]
MPRERPRRRPATADELDGLLEGLRALAATRRREGRADASAEKLLVRAADALHHHRDPEAETFLLTAERILREQSPEVELLEFPRGLVGYVPSGERGAPPQRDEEQLSNRLLLVQRLLAVRRAEGASLDDLVERLNEAEAAYRKGDRSTARRLVDAVHDRLDMGDAPGRGAREA